MSDGGSKVETSLGTVRSDEARTLVETEYTALREEIATGLATIRAIETAVLGGTGALVAWLLANPAIRTYAWLLPLALVAAAGARALVDYRSVRLVGEFIRRRELVLGLSSGESPAAEATKGEDERIQGDVSDRLAAELLAQAAQIQVNVTHGEVTLSGTVDTPDARHRA